jgi:hypothetical protein
VEEVQPVPLGMGIEQQQRRIQHGYTQQQVQHGYTQQAQQQVQQQVQQRTTQYEAGAGAAAAAAAAAGDTTPTRSNAPITAAGGTAGGTGAGAAGGGTGAGGTGGTAADGTGAVRSYSAPGSFGSSRYGQLHTAEAAPRGPRTPRVPSNGSFNGTKSSHQYGTAAADYLSPAPLPAHIRGRRSSTGR